MIEFGGAARKAAEAWQLVLTAGRYAIVGGICFAVNILIMFIANVLIGINYVEAAILACLVTIPTGYLLHRRISFRVSAQWRGEIREFARFALFQLVQFSLGLGMLVILVQRLGFTPMWGTVVMTALMFGFGFAANATWVFRIVNWRADRRNPTIYHTANKLRVLQVSAFYPSHGGGVEVVVGEIARRLAESGLRVHWMAGGNPQEKPGHSVANLTIEQASSLDFIERTCGLPFPLWSLSSLRSLWRAVRDCEVVHVHDILYVPTLTATFFAQLLRRPVVVTKHIGNIEFKSRIANATLWMVNHLICAFVVRRVSQVIFVGRPALEYFQRFARFRRPPILICNGVDHGVYHPGDGQRLEHEFLQCLFVGRFVEKKGLALLRESLDMPGIRWIFIGWGPMSPLGWGPLPDRVEVHTDLRASEVVPYYQSADLLVLPSTGEGFPLVVQEALACGTPALVSQEVAEAFPKLDHRCVFAVELRTADPAAALRSRLEALVMDKAKVRDARESASLLAQQWSWDACVDQYRDLYRDVANAPAKSDAAS